MEIAHAAYLVTWFQRKREDSPQAARNALKVAMKGATVRSWATRDRSSSQMNHCHFEA
ncbi:MAG TPA: hypothetical protein VKV40_08420 [Ktedonobacteraceae bacterium]|nr:hypothetical protein [Ktedonobacteraceae bacterium]